MNLTIFWLIMMQILLGLFGIGMSIGLTNTGSLEGQDALILIYGVLSWGVWLRCRRLIPSERTLIVFLQNILVLTLVSWIFHPLWGPQWQSIILTVFCVSLVALVVCQLIEHQYGRSVKLNTGLISPLWWKIGGIIALTSTNVTIFFVLISHESLAPLWLLVGWTWVFLWQMAE